MASGKVARRTAVGDVQELLESPEVAALVTELDALHWTGRKGYGARTLVGACLVKTLFALPTWTRVVALIEEHAGLQAILGETPSIWACYRFANKLREQKPLLDACLDRIAASLRDAIPDLGRDVAIDASDLPAYANGQRFVSKGGRERERFADPDASWGHRSAVSTRKGGGFYGYKLNMAVCTRTDLPLTWQVETARRHESLFVARLLDKTIARGFTPQTIAMDKGYSNPRVRAEAAERGCVPIIPALKGRTIPFSAIPYGSNQWTALYRRRAAVEREFGRLKHDYALAPLRVRGLARVQLHADLTILGRLGQALARTREQRLAA